MRILTNIFINTNNKFLSLNENYFKILKIVKSFVFQQIKIKDNLEIHSINDEICLLEAMQLTYDCIFYK